MSTDCYIARRGCGCVHAIVGDTPDLKQMAAIIKVMIEAGLQIERGEADYTTVTPPRSCPHIKRDIDRQLSMLPLIDQASKNGNGIHPENELTEGEPEPEAVEEIPDNNDGGYTGKDAADEGLDEAIAETDATGDELVSAEVPAVE